MGRTSPTQRSLAALRKRGYEAEVVEKWNPFARKRQDLFGFIDIVAIGRGRVIGVQTTTRSNMSARRNKIKASDKAVSWLKAGAKIELHGWVKKKGKWEAVVERMRNLDG